MSTFDERPQQRRDETPMQEILPVNGHLPDRYTIAPENSVDTETIPIETKTLPPSIPQICGYSKREFFKVEPALIRYKAFFFFFGGAIGAVFPFFSVYYKQLGLSPNQIGIISGSRPLVGFASGPAWGSLADRFRIRRIMLIISTLAWLGFITSIGFVPPPNLSEDTCPVVSDFLGHENVSSSFSNSSVDNEVVDRFHDLHVLRPDITAHESLMESRGWIYDFGDLNRVYATILALVILGEIFQSPAGALADSGCIDHLGAKEFDKYGYQRAWGSFGLGLMSMLAGAAVSTTRVNTSACDVPYVLSNYRVAFYIFAACMVGCVFAAFTFRFQKQKDDHAQDKPKPNPLKVFRMFMTWHYGSWLFCMLFTGICNGVIWGFLFWHMENIGGTQMVMGAASVICHVSEIIMFFLIFHILKKTGHLTFMVLGLTGYSIRFIVFAAMDNPWLVLPFEVLQGFTFAGIWSVYAKYLSSSVPPEYMGTLQGFLHGVYWGLGSGSGHMIGGILVEKFGARVTFWVFSVASFLNMLIFLLIQKLTKRPNVFGSSYETLDQ